MGNDYGKIAIVAGGQLDAKFLPQIIEADFTIGVDFGAFWLLEQGIVPDIAIGDFDSVSKEQYIKIKQTIPTVLSFPAKKDATDLELAVGEAIKKKPREVWIFGGLGSRFDHSFAGMQMLARLESHNICGYLVDKNNKIHIVRRLEEFSRGRNYKYISFFSLTDSSTIALDGFAYNGKKLQLLKNSTLGVSNEILDKTAIITVFEGLVLVVQSRD